MRSVLNVEEMFIYKITNRKNNKCYIGQTIRPIKQRFNRHINDSLNNIINTKFARAIRKYGKDSFYIEKIDEASNQEELNRKEQYWIRTLNTIKEGYNETDALCKCGGNTYQNKTEQEMMSIKEKISKSKIGGLNPNSHKIKCRNEETLEEYIFDTVKECRDFFGEKNHRFITTRVLNEVNSLFKKVWNFAYVNEEYADRTKDVIRTGVVVKAVDLENGNVTTYKSLSALERKLGVSRQRLKRLINNEHNDFVIQNTKFISTKCVSTIGDECSQVELEIGTSSKRRAIEIWNI